MSSSNTFTIAQPFPEAALQFYPELGSIELETLINAYIPTAAPYSDKFSDVTIDFFMTGTIDITTGAKVKHYTVYTFDNASLGLDASFDWGMWDSSTSGTMSLEQSPEQFLSNDFNDFDLFAGASGLDSPLMFTPSPGASSSPASSAAASFSYGTSSFVASTPAPAPARQSVSTGRVTKKSTAKKEKRAVVVDEARIPGFSIMTKDGVDVTNSAGRGTKTKEQREHAHMMRIMKACDACKRKKVRCDPSHPRPGITSPQSQPSSSQTSPSSAMMSRTTSYNQPLSHTLSSSSQYGDTLFMQQNVSPTLYTTDDIGSFTTPSPMSRTSSTSSSASAGLIQQRPPATLTNPGGPTVSFKDIYPHSGRPSTISATASHGRSQESCGVEQQLRSSPSSGFAPGDSIGGSFESAVNHNPVLQGRSGSTSSQGSSSGSSLWSQSSNGSISSSAFSRKDHFREHFRESHQLEDSIWSQSSSGSSSSESHLVSARERYREHLATGDSVASPSLQKRDQQRDSIARSQSAVADVFSDVALQHMQSTVLQQERDSIPGLLHASSSQPKQRSSSGGDLDTSVVHSRQDVHSQHQQARSSSASAGVQAQADLLRRGSDHSSGTDTIISTVRNNGIIANSSGAFRTVEGDSSSARHGRERVQHTHSVYSPIEALQRRSRLRSSDVVEQTSFVSTIARKGGQQVLSQSSTGLDSVRQSHVLPHQQVSSVARSTLTPAREKSESKLAPLSSSRSSPIQTTMSRTIAKDETFAKKKISDSESDSISDLSTQLASSQAQQQLSTSSSTKKNLQSRTQPTPKQVKSFTTPRTSLDTNSIPSTTPITFISRNSFTQMFSNSSKQQDITQSLWKTLLSLIVLVAMQYFFCAAGVTSRRVDALGYSAFETWEGVDSTSFSSSLGIVDGGIQQRLVEIL